MKFKKDIEGIRELIQYWIDNKGYCYTSNKGIYSHEEELYSDNSLNLVAEKIKDKKGNLVAISLNHYDRSRVMWSIREYLDKNGILVLYSGDNGFRDVKETLNLIKNKIEENADLAIKARTNTYQYIAIANHYFNKFKIYVSVMSSIGEKLKKSQLGKYWMDMFFIDELNISDIQRIDKEAKEEIKLKEEKKRKWNEREEKRIKKKIAKDLKEWKKEKIKSMDICFGGFKWKLDYPVLKTNNGLVASTTGHRMTIETFFKLIFEIENRNLEGKILECAEHGKSSISEYYLTEIGKEYIKIGCHKVPITEINRIKKEIQS